jgi:Rieske Fe-S protein
MANDPSAPTGPSTSTSVETGIDERIDDATRAGLTGTARSNAYEATRDPEDISRAPDVRDELNPPEWRSDFPIDWPKDEFVARRDFAKFLVLTSGAFVAGQAWIAAQDLIRDRRASPERVKVAALGDVPVGGVLTFTYPREHDRCILVRLGERDLVAFSQSCTHLSCAVIPRVDRGVFECPCHDGFFDLRTGKNISGPPPRPLPQIELELQGDEVYAVGVQERTVV